MNLSEYLGFNYITRYTTDELYDMFSKHNNLDVTKFAYDIYFLGVLHRIQKHDVHLFIKFIDMFEDINKNVVAINRQKNDSFYSLAGRIIMLVCYGGSCDEIYVYKIVDYLLKKNMSVPNNIINYGFNYVGHRINIKTSELVDYIMKNHNVIQHVRKLINNYDILLFDITNDLQFVESLLLISKCRQKKLPKCIIICKILYYYLLGKNIMYNKDDSTN